MAFTPCPNCGAQNLETDKKCWKCGAEINNTFSPNSTVRTSIPTKGIPTKNGATKNAANSVGGTTYNPASGATVNPSHASAVNPASGPTFNPSHASAVNPASQSAVNPSHSPKISSASQHAVNPATPVNAVPSALADEKTEHVNDSGKLRKKDKKKWRVLLLVAIALLCLAGGVGGYFYYKKVYLPEKIDREAKRTYPMVNLMLRSSKMTGGDFNKIISIPYGSELITYEDDGEWAKVKYILPSGETTYEGYAASKYLLDKKDFYILNSMLSDDDVREVIASSKVRKALLDYFNQNGYAGKLSQELQSEVGLNVPESNQWQVIFHHGQTKPNEILFKRLVNPTSKYPDMTVLIENVGNHDRKALIFHFEDDETPHLIYEEDFPRYGSIRDVVPSDYGYGYDIIMVDPSC